MIDISWLLKLLRARAAYQRVFKDTSFGYNSFTSPWFVWVERVKHGD